jgi:hypothetical protein
MAVIRFSILRVGYLKIIHLQNNVIMKKLIKLSALALLTMSTNCVYAQWDGSAPPVNTSTTGGNVGIGLGPVFDARLHLLTTSDVGSIRPWASSLDLIPGVLIQRDFYSTGFSMPGQPANIMEIWKEDYTGAFTAGLGNQLKFVVDYQGWVGLNKLPATTFDVGGNSNVDGYATIGGPSTYSATDKLIVNGDVSITKPLDAQWRNIRARSHDGALTIMTGNDGTDGAYIQMHGMNNNDFSAPGSIFFGCYGNAGNPGFDFINYDPSSSSWNSRMRISTDGKVAIGPNTMTTPNGYRLYVDDGILTKRIKVALPSDPSNWADFVFDESYELRPLKEVESYISKHKHLPEIPSTKDVHENGIDLAEIDAKLLQKIEELTLYVIQQQKEIEGLRQRIKK